MTTTLLPFLYQTRTILKPPRASVAFLRSLHVTSRCLKGSDIPFASEIGANAPKDPLKRGTITPTERQIFERIFADIKARGLKSSIPDDASQGPTTAASRSAMLIMQQAAQDAGQARPAHVPGLGLLAGAAKDRNKALLRFPPELRAAARKALSAIDPSIKPEEETTPTTVKPYVDEQWKAPAHTFNRKVELDAKRYPERIRVESLITSAPTDQALWEVLEREVFSMPEKLGLTKRDEEADTSAEETADGPKKRGRKPKAKDPSGYEAPAINPEPMLEAVPEDGAEIETITETVGETEAAEEVVTKEAIAEEVIAKEIASREAAAEENYIESPNAQAEEMSLYVHGPLYPAYLLLALRRLDSAFHTSSPLALHILPRIKELGLESYVLGVSTPFYNELLDIYWSRYGDLSGMLDLLEEMRHCGLYFDNQTSSILGRVQFDLESMASNERHGSFSAALMTMPQYERSMRKRIRHWHRAVDMSIVERGEDLGY